MELPTHPKLEFRVTTWTKWSDFVKGENIRTNVSSRTWLDVLSPYRNYFILSNN